LEPNCTLATNQLARKKLQEERLIIAFTTNADGSMKLPPFIIYKYAYTQTFLRRNISNLENLGILWSANTKAWMTIALSERFLLDFERKTSCRKRKIIIVGK
jgi:hypothetical protein